MTGNIEAESIGRQSMTMTVFTTFTDKILRKAGADCVGKAFYHFFFRQYKSALLKNVSVVNVEHELDEKIPFLPEKVGVYLGFVAFWARASRFLNRAYPDRKAVTAGFIRSMGDLYEMAAEIYAVRLSTTKRPACLSAFRFMLIYAFDPHLMCVPSLHIMVVIRAYTAFADLTRAEGDEARFAAQAAELREGALAITESVLYVKQHSVNCVAAAMYAMTRFDPPLFPESEAEAFTAALFRDGVLSDSDAALVRARILSLYRQFLDEGGVSDSWTKPLLAFLEEKKAA